MIRERETRRDLAKSYYFFLFTTSMATTAPTTARMMRNIMKQIQRFRRADRAEVTAFSV